MAEAEPSRKLHRLAIGVAAIVVAAMATVLALRPMNDPPSPTRQAPVQPQVVEPRAEQPGPAPSGVGPAVLSREDLLAAARAGAAAYAEGEDSPAEIRALAGRRFQLRIPFGCQGPQASAADSSAAWEIGPEGETLRVRVRPEDWTASPFAQALAGADVEAVEGFWIPRPWQNSEACPARSNDPLLAEAPPPSPQTVGVATVYGPESSRLGRRADRPYELTLSMKDTGQPGEEGLQLILEGRIASLGVAGPVACRSASPDQRPVCLIGTTIERVAVRSPRSERVLGEWRDGSALTPAPSPPTSPAGSAGGAPRG